MSIVFINPAFAEPTDVEIDWIIEGQSKSLIVSPDIESEKENMDNVEVKKNENESLKIAIEQESYEDFITGSGYTIGDKIITIESEEGQILNKMLI